MSISENVRKMVRERYTARAGSSASCCGSTRSCCGQQDSVSTKIGYSTQELGSIPKGADLGLGCGNPTALASLKPGETVLDLGSGAGIDCFLAANRVGPAGHVIGVDMTSAMLDRARDNARQYEAANVEFRLGEIENLPVADATVDVAISNCVVNLSPDKPRVFREVYRVLKPGGRLLISDIVTLKPLPETVTQSMEAYAQCVAGASDKRDYLSMIQAAGFSRVEVVSEVVFGGELSCGDSPRVIVDGREVDSEEIGLSPESARELAGSLASISVRAFK